MPIDSLLDAWWTSSMLLIMWGQNSKPRSFSHSVLSPGRLGVCSEGTILVSHWVTPAHTSASCDRLSLVTSLEMFIPVVPRDAHCLVLTENTLGELSVVDNLFDFITQFSPTHLTGEYSYRDGQIWWWADKTDGSLLVMYYTRGVRWERHCIMYGIWRNCTWEQNE